MSLVDPIAHVAAPQIPLFGSQPLPQEDPYSPYSHYVQKWERALSSSQLGNKNPLWNDEEELQLMGQAGYNPQHLMSFQVPGNSFTSYLNDRFSKRHPVADLNIPRDPVAMMQISLRYGFENPFVARAARVKTDFTVKDFKHKSVKPSIVEFYDQQARRLHLKYLLRKIVWNLYVCGVAPIYWGGEDGGQIPYIQVIDPRQVVIEEIFGFHKMWIKIDASMVAAVRDPQGKEHPKNKALYQSMPKYWIKQIQDHIQNNTAMGLIELEDGSYTVVENRYAAMNRTINTLDGIPLQPAFDALQRYRLFAAGDFAIAWNVKNMITLISEGDPKNEKSYVPSDTTRLNKLAQQFAKPDYSLVVFCDPTTEVRYIIPPIEALDPKKYAQIEKEIKEVLNLPSFMWSSSGGSSFADSVSELKLLREEVEAVRILLDEQFFFPFYNRLRVGATRPGFGSKDIITPTFDLNSLRDDAIWLEARKEQYGVGALSLHSLIETYGDDPEYELAMLKKEHEDLGTNLSERDNPTYAQPIFEPQQGNQKPEPPEPPGRPGKPDGQPRRPRRAGK